MGKLPLSIAASTIVITLVIGGIYGGMRDWLNASPNPETTHNETSSKDMAALMASMSIQQLPEPVTAPDFNLLSLAEEEIKLSEHRGKVILLSFWTTW